MPPLRTIVGWLIAIAIIIWIINNPATAAADIKHAVSSFSTLVTNL